MTPSPNHKGVGSHYLHKLIFSRTIDFPDIRTLQYWPANRDQKRK